MNYKKLRALQQQASEFAGLWRVDKEYIYNEDNNTIATVYNDRLANYICMIHNTWLILSNHILLLRRALFDRDALAQLERKEK